VILCKNEHFESINGFSNDYWGWGYEDMDLAKRFSSVGLSTARRKGTFSPLQHRHNGYETIEVPTPEAQKNAIQFAQRWSASDGHWSKDGLNTATFRVVERIRIDPPNMERQIRVERVRVEFPHRQLHYPS
jgi:hypothetical protein